MAARMYRRAGQAPAKAWGREQDTPGLAETAELARRFGGLQDDEPHGMLPSQIDSLSEKFREGLGEMEGRVIRPGHDSRSEILNALPFGASPSMFGRTGQISPTTGHGSHGLSGGGQSLFTTMKPYQPEYESPDRQFFPIHRRLANSYFRLFFKLDAIVGAVIELLSELPWSDFQLTGEGVDGEIKETLEYMLNECGIRTILPYLVREFLVVGEVIPHCHFDDSKGIWTHVALHNPDQINVVYSPFIKMDTIMEFVPDPKLREIVSSDHPMLARVRESMPPELLAHLRAGTNIPLSPVNATFIPRKLHPYDLRGASIQTRLWRTYMAEDGLWAAFIATARRAANAITLVKLGDPTTGTIPPPSEEKKVASLLAQAEADPVAKLIYNYQIATETIGTPERLMSVNTHNELFEKLKLIALGVSKSFISGESSYSSSAAGLTVFLQRLKAMRDFFVNEWLIPRFFMPVAIANQWVKPSKAGASQGHVRVKRSSLDLMDERMYIVPTIEWSKSLDPNIDKERIDAMNALENNLHIKITDQKKYACLGLDSEEEQKQLVEEYKFKKDLAGQDPELQQLLGLAAAPGAEGGPSGGGGGGNVLSPGIPPESFGLPGEEGGGAPGGGPEGAPGGGGGGGGEGSPVAGGSSGGESVSAAEGDQAQPLANGAGNGTNGSRPASSKNWAHAVLDPVVRLFDTFDPSNIEDDQTEPWVDALKDPAIIQALASHDRHDLWEAVEGWLVDENYPSASIQELSSILTDLGKLRHVNGSTDAELERMAKEYGVMLEDSDNGNLLIGASGDS